MTFPTDWDIDKYRVDYECEDHWELRRRFLETHKDKFPEERLVCLAQVFYNVEFMGCSYPEKTMRLVAELSNGVADEHREKTKTKLQGTFVQASEAATMKIKGPSENEDTAHSEKEPLKFLKSTDEDDKTIKIQNNATNPPEETPQNLDEERRNRNRKKKERKKRKKLRRAMKQKMKNAAREIERKSKMMNKETTAAAENTPDISAISSIETTAAAENTPDISAIAGIETTAAAENTPGGSPIADQCKISNPLTDFVLVESEKWSPFDIISKSANLGGKCVTQLVDRTSNAPNVNVTMLLDGYSLAKASGSNLQDAKKNCSSESLQKLRESCYTVKLKKDFAGPVVEKVNDSISKITESTPNKEPNNLVKDTKVNRMMKLMGWSGGGLGKNQQGREEPVEVVKRVKRVGLGAESTLPRKKGSAVQKVKRSKGETAAVHKFRICINDMLKKYCASDASHDLVFSSDHSKQERYLIHLISNKLQLKNKSYGIGDNRQLVVSKKRTPQQILSDVLKAGGSTDKYDAVPPGSL